MDRIDNPFDLDNVDAYAAWRERRLAAYPVDVGNLVVEVRDPRRLTVAEREAILERCRAYNMAVYAGARPGDADKSVPQAIAQQFGLSNPDRNMGADDNGVTALKVMEGEWHGEYIPYTNRPIHWHTDGYYNKPEQRICALLLHCVSPAVSGGENALLDPEIAYLHLRDADPEYIRALMAPNAMTIPANIKDGKVIRPVRTGPVFSLLNDGALHMRYTARLRNIEWAAHSLLGEAVQALNALLASASPAILRVTLQSGQGLLSNNVLHDRSGFEDSETQHRVLYRLRYYQRIAGT
jgi:hypothetical protein